MQDEAGASDNRISWNPSEFPAMKDWQDGQTYRVTMIIRQTTGGEGTIESVESAAPAEAGQPPVEQPQEEAAEGQEPSPPMDMEGRGYGTGNPAIDKLIRSPKA